MLYLIVTTLSFFSNVSLCKQPTCLSIDILAHRQSCMHAHVQANTHTPMYTHTHTHTHTFTRTIIHTRIHVHAHMHTHTRLSADSSKDMRLIQRKKGSCAHETIARTTTERVRSVIFVPFHPLPLFLFGVGVVQRSLLNWQRIGYIKNTNV